jgi:hypothetical protein
MGQSGIFNVEDNPARIQHDCQAEGGGHASRYDFSLAGGASLMIAQNMPKARIALRN